MQSFIKKLVFVFSVVAVSLVNAPISAHAWFFGIGSHRGYSQVVVGGNTYYYNDGNYYTGGPGNYVTAEAPEGAVIYHTPPHYQRVVVEGRPYFVSNGVYYEHEGRGYRVVHARQWRNDRHDDHHDSDQDHHQWDRH